MNINFIGHIKTYYILSGLLAAAAIFAVIVWGLQPGIDLTGGSILEIEFDQAAESGAIAEKMAEFNLGEVVIQPTGEKGFLLRLKEVNEETHQAIILKLQEISMLKELRFESIGPVIGQELRDKTIVLVIVSLIALLIYIAISFRKVVRPISGWKYGVVSVITLAFDVLIVLGLFSLLGKYYDVQFTIPIITALLTILGYTINDKVIVFDRVRENVFKHSSPDFASLVNDSLNQTVFRSISTGICSILVLLAIYFFGGETLKYFSLALIVGIVAGTYSSLFIASPILVSWERFGQKKSLRRK